MANEAVADRTVSIWEDINNWPNCSQAARLIGVNQATLSRQIKEGRVSGRRSGFGKGVLLLSPAEVLRVAMIYGRVPLDDLKRSLASTTATKLGLTQPDEMPPKELIEELVAGLERLPIDESTPITMQGTTMQSAVKANSNRATDPRRMQPRRVRRGEIPTADTLRALDSIRPMKRRVEIVPAKVIDLGRKQPGRKY